MKKDIKWLRNKLVYLHELDMWNWKQCEPNSKEQSHFYGCLAAYERVLDFLDELDEPETLSINKEQLIKRIENYIPLHDKTVGDVVDGILETIKQLPEMEVISQDWIDEHAVAVTYDGIPDETEIVYVDELENLLVPKQEELESKIQELIEVYKQEEDAYSNPENGWIGGFIEDLKNLVADEPKYYALIKGHELTDSTFRYWNFDVLDNYLFVSNRVFKHGRFLTKTSKSEWGKLGINDSNADFVKVEEVEE